MREINVIVVDTFGAPTQALVDKYPHVASWDGHPAPGATPGRYNPHGGFCAEKILTALHDADAVKVHMKFLQIFDQNTAWVDMDARAWDWLYVKAMERETYINNSWGVYIGAERIPADGRELANKWRRFIGETGARVTWAAGNSGDFNSNDDRELPQCELRDVSVAIGSTNSRGRTSLFSSDSVSAPPTACMWGENVILFNATTGSYTRGSGTSYAAPKGTALWAAGGLAFDEYLAFIRSEALFPPEFEAARPHPKWGYGWLEPAYQRLLCGSPYLYMRKIGVLGTEGLDGQHWFDYKPNTVVDLAGDPQQD